MSSETDVYKKIRSHPGFEKLVRTRSSYSWLLSIVVLVLFYGFVLLVAFNPSAMAVRLGGDSMYTLGITLMFSMFVLFWILTALYVKRANSEFDDMRDAILKDVTKGGRK